MRRTLTLLGALLLLWAHPVAASGATPAAAAVPAVRVGAGTLTLPTYELGPPDVNPWFDLFARRPFLIYPYTALTHLTDHRQPKTWRTLELENEYLKVVVLPDLGGRIYSCVDKASGQEMLYANPSIKYADVAYRGAWVALGVEFNFPVSHNWMTVSPVDSATTRHEDGSASIVVGNVDRVYGMTWRVELTLRPGRSLLEETVTLENGSDVRHRFYWWNTASVEVNGDSHILYPMEFTAAHGFADVDTWPVDSSGTDLSYPRNHTGGYVSRFAYATREPFMGVYDPKTRSGVVHVAPHEEVPGKKIWSWGWDDEGRDWQRALSDNQSAYVEVQAGLFRNQETYAFLEPQQSLQFHEYYLPVRGIGGYTRASTNGVVNLRRDEKGALAVGLNLTLPVRGGRLVVKDGDRVVHEEALSLEPSGVLEETLALLTAPGPYTVEVDDASGSTLLAHTEGRFDFRPRSQVEVGPQPSYAYPPPGARSEGDWLGLGEYHELNGRLLQAHDVYEQGLAAFPSSFELTKAQGRLDVQLKRYDDAARLLEAAVERASNDAEALYYLGLARVARGETQKARFAWDQAATLPELQSAALLQLGRLACRDGDRERGLRLIQRSLSAAPTMPALGLEVALLRRAGLSAEATERLARAPSEDAASSFLRYERGLLQGKEDEALLRHLAADPERVIGIAALYMSIGLYDDAEALLARAYPAPEAREPGTVLPQDYPLVAYYRGYCRERAGGEGRADFDLASRQSTLYVFPSRPETFAVLDAALAVNPEDATAHFLLGSLYLSGGLADQALVEWEKAKALDPDIPVLHRNMGFAHLYARGDAQGALALFEEGMSKDPKNLDVYLGADQALSLLGRGAEERIAVLKRYPDEDPQLVLQLALALTEAGRFDEAEAQLRGRYFPREEFGTNVRQVYVEVRVQRALALARGARRKQALAVVDGLGKPVAGFDFTKDGMAPFVESGRVQYLLGEIASTLGDETLAREHWGQAEKDRNYRQVAWAWRAAAKLGEASGAEWPEVLRTALDQADTYLFRGGHYPGVATCARGLLLRALGREGEAEEALHQVFLFPDKGMPHYMARLAAQEK